MTATKPTPGGWLATLQQQFMDGENCDVIVRASIEQPNAKRARVGDGVATSNDANAQQQQQQQEQQQ